MNVKPYTSDEIAVIRDAVAAGVGKNTDNEHNARMLATIDTARAVVPDAVREAAEEALRLDEERRTAGLTSNEQSDMNRAALVLARHVLAGGAEGTVFEALATRLESHIARQEMAGEEETAHYEADVRALDAYRAARGTR